MSMTYYYFSHRGFANEYSVGIATDRDSRMLYSELGYERITRKRALRELTNRGDAATKIYASVSIDGADIDDRFGVAANLRNGAISFDLRKWE